MSPRLAARPSEASLRRGLKHGPSHGCETGTPASDPALPRATGPGSQIPPSFFKRRAICCPQILPRVTADLPRLCQTQHTVQLWSASVGPWRRTSGSSRLEPVSALDAAGLHTTNTPSNSLPRARQPGCKEAKINTRRRALPCSAVRLAVLLLQLVLQKKKDRYLCEYKAGRGWIRYPGQA